MPVRIEYLKPITLQQVQDMAKGCNLVATHVEGDIYEYEGAESMGFLLLGMYHAKHFWSSIRHIKPEEYEPNNHQH